MGIFSQIDVIGPCHFGFSGKKKMRQKEVEAELTQKREWSKLEGTGYPSKRPFSLLYINQIPLSLFIQCLSQYDLHVSPNHLELPDTLIAHTKYYMALYYMYNYNISTKYIIKNKWYKIEPFFIYKEYNIFEHLSQMQCFFHVIFLLFIFGLWRQGFSI